MGSLSPSPLHLGLPFTTTPHPPLKTPSVLSLTTTHASFQKPTPHSTPPPLLPSFLKPLAGTLALSAAFLSLRLTSPCPSLALSPPPSPSLSSPDTADADALRSHLELNLNLQNLTGAISALDRLLLLHPNPNDRRDLLLLKAHLHRHAGDPAAARRAFEDLLEGNPLAAEAYQGLLVISMKESNKDEVGEVVRRVEAAVEACRREGRERELRDLRIVVAQVRVTEGKLREAIGVYEELAREDPADFRPPLYLGIVYSMMRRKGEAERQFERYRQLVPKENPFSTKIERNLAVMRAVGMKQKQ